MQIIQSKTNFVEKVLRDKEGRLVRARFAVYENAGRIKARLVDFVYIEEVKQIVGSILKLATTIAKKLSWSENPLKSFVLHFVTIDNIYFSGSKPRAPTLI